MPYYFPKQTLQKGSKMLLKVPFQYQAAVWWQRKALELNFTAAWVPENTPTLIIGAKYDCIAPFSLFQNDARFQRPNIRMVYIEDAGHMPWVENPEATKRAFSTFIKKLEKE